MISSRLFYLLLLIALAVFAVAHPGTVSMLLIIAQLFASTVMIVWSLFARRKIEMSIKAEDAGEDRLVSYQIAIRNGSFFPITCCQIHLTCINLFDERTIQTKFFMTVPPRGSQTLNGQLRVDSVGVHEIRCKKCFFTDWFRLFRRKIKPPEPTEFCVWPKIHIITSRLVNMPTEDLDCDHFSPDRAGSLPGDFFGVRDYREGDRLQFIHWKLTGKTGDLVVKEFSLPLKNKISLLLDFSPHDSQPVINAIMDTAATLSGFFLEEKVDHELCFLKQGILCRFAISSQDHLFESIRDFLSRPPDCAELAALHAYRQSSAGKHLICISGNPATQDAPDLLEHPMSAALMLVRENREKTELVPNFVNQLHIIPIEAADVGKSLTGLEL